jgi:hypothetical protein
MLLFEVRLLGVGLNTRCTLKRHLRFPHPCTCAARAAQSLKSTSETLLLVTPERIVEPGQTRVGSGLIEADMAGPALADNDPRHPGLEACPSNLRDALLIFFSHPSVLLALSAITGTAGWRVGWGGPLTVVDAAAAICAATLWVVQVRVWTQTYFQLLYGFVLKKSLLACCLATVVGAFCELNC